VTLNRRAAGWLAKHDVTVWATAEVGGNAEAIESILLRRRATR
jgi:hypothetical protein